MFWTVPPRSTSDLIRMPWSVLVKVQFMTVMFDTPPDVKLPMLTPCPKPNVQFVIRISEDTEALLPTATLSSPVLIMQSRMRALVSARSSASVLCEGLGEAPDEGAYTLIR